MPDAPPNYRACAQFLADQISKSWDTYISPSLNFWRIANAFTTLIDYYAITQQSNLSLGKATHKAFLDKNTPDWWYDDYSWWGVAFLRAKQYSRFVGDYTPTWGDLAKTCWDEMAPATKVWENADKTIFAEAKPRFDGGCWNRYFVVDKCNPLDKKDPWPACGIQNTVTNLQYLVFGARFSQAEDAKREYGWLEKWFSASLPADQKLQANYEGVGTLIRERVSTYAQDASGKYPDVLNYVKDRHWTGDQGIFLGVLLEMVRLDPGNATVYYAMARPVLDAVRTKLVNAQQILQPWIPAGTMGSIYLTDYATGVGVYMRYLLYVASNDATLKQFISSEASKSFIKANADAVCASLGTCQSLPGGDPFPDQMECWLNQLAVLNAAITLLG